MPGEKLPNVVPCFSFALKALNFAGGTSSERILKLQQSPGCRKRPATAVSGGKNS